MSEAAQRYAAAVFDLAEEAGALDAVDRDLTAFAEALEGSADLAVAAASPLIAAEEKSRALSAVAQLLGLSELGRNLVGVAARNGRAAELPGVARAYRTRLAQHRGAREVEIVSAAPLEPAQRDDLIAALTQALKLEIRPTLTVDPRLIGGFMVRAGSRQYDASVRTQLDSMKRALKAG